jgi:hypothetical protein
MKTAIIILGNNDIINSTKWKNISNKFYNDLKKYLEDRNFKVEFDEGKEFTKPKQADLWIAHSRGVDRLRFASKETATISIGSHKLNSINNSKDTALTKGDKLTQYHFILSDEMKREIDLQLSKMNLLL